MEEWIRIVQTHSEVLTVAAIVFMGLILAISLSRILRQIKKLNRSLTSITNNIQAYFDVIMQEEPPVAEEQPAQEEQHGYEQKKMYDERTKEEQNLLEDSKRQEGKKYSMPYCRNIFPKEIQIKLVFPLDTP